MPFINLCHTCYRRVDWLCARRARRPLPPTAIAPPYRLRVTPRSPRMPLSGATTVQHTKNTSTTNEEPIKNISMQQCDNKSRTVLQRGVQQVVRKVQHPLYLATDSDVTPSNRSPLQGLVDRTTSIPLAIVCMMCVTSKYNRTFSRK